MGRRALLLLMVVVLSACSGPVNKGIVSDGPEQIVGMFYRLLLANPVQGVQKVQLYRPFSPLLQQSLWLRLVQANQAEVVMTQRDGNYRTSLTGVLFTSWYQGISDFTLEKCDIQKRVAHCQVSLIYSKPDLDIQWQDELLLKQGRLGWQIEDVIYDKARAFSPRSNLSQRLDEVVALSR